MLAGATGLVGRALLARLLADPAYSNVHVVGRRAPNDVPASQQSKLRVHTVDFANTAQLAALPKADDLYIALGTTIKVAGSQAAFKAVDFDAVVALAQQQCAPPAPENIASRPGVRLGVVSAMGADPQSRVFYNRIKGEMEAAVSKLGFASVSIARPSMLDGAREHTGQPARAGERVALAFMKPLAFLIPADYEAIHVDTVAAALHRMVREGQSGVRIALSGELQQLGH
jgi:uncharacterized protein YbjT (DUF2867 family)